MALEERDQVELEACVACPSRLVHPLAWRRLSADSWQLDLRCPDCGEVRTAEVATATVRRYDRVLQEARASLEAHLAEIERLEREETADQFARQLETGLIQPDDFRP